ncbi:hypothetical protein HHX47_DHR3000914 [Lentinula edodes]|nr:hypothetical protein HHX47_DHR3000914 [Lentinula edodes]
MAKQRSGETTQHEVETPSAMVASNYFLDRSMQFLVVALSVAAFFLFRGGLEWQSSTSYVLCSPEDTEKIYTVDNANSRVQCMLINNAVITHTGSLETVARVRNYILSNADIHSDKSKFVLGGGWDHTFWPSGAWPTAEDLESDPVIRGRPVVLQSKDCHALWLSQKALESSLPFPQEVDGGLIVRDASGKPTGMLLDNAQELVKQPKLLEDDLLRRFDSAIQNAVKFGLTSIHDAGLDPASLKFFKQLWTDANFSQIRIYGMSYFDENGEYWGNTTQPLIATGGERLTARSVKIFADGALRTGGAALYEPYADNSITNGLMRIDKDVLFKYIPLFLRDGWQVNVHAIGDRANGLVVDAFEASLNGVNVTALRPRLEHAQLMTKADMHRVGKLGGKFPEQRLTREEALRGMTIDPAYASFTESILGSLEVGKRADFVVFSQDIMTIPVPEILFTKVLGTAVDGKLVYGAI